ncbi:hypothetical protein [Pleionea sp. CnH1-48]|uniref:hypothetical protein n=1 Tax=Pleionea sp. CnH1-48 TaxID=2954494 RepID=UPI002097EDFE|nr:hypothetical protein [Pleionea sp. CnH1-48]MCO7227559.1 hypothetical protein [Pleionea sp. CnH1-48]
MGIRKAFNWQGVPALIQFQQLQRCELSLGYGKFLKGQRAFNYYFPVKPKSYAQTYDVQIYYKEQSSPITYIKSPSLIDLAKNRFGKDTTIPHLYQQGEGKVCLYHQNEWHSKMFLHESIVPWTYLYLYYFEHWLMTGEWDGGSAPGCLHENIPPVDLED